MKITRGMTRRTFIKGTGAGLFMAGLNLSWPLPIWAKSADNGIDEIAAKTRYDLTIGYSPITIDGRKGVSTGINGSVPGPLVIDPKDGEPFDFDRDYAVVLSDWSFDDPETIFNKINWMGHYYNFQRRTVTDFYNDAVEKGFTNALAERMAWGKMRMRPVDLADVTGHAYTYLMNGHSPDMNWTALFTPGETIRLRFINASTRASTTSLWACECVMKSIASSPPMPEFPGAENSVKPPTLRKPKAKKRRSPVTWPVSGSGFKIH